MSQTPTRANRTVAISNSTSPEIIWGLGGPEEDHQLHHCCWTGRVSEREGEEEDYPVAKLFVLDLISNAPSSKVWVACYKALSDDLQLFKHV